MKYFYSCNQPVDNGSSLDCIASKVRASERKRKKAWLHFIILSAGPRKTRNEQDIRTQVLPNTKTTTFGSKDTCIMRINRTIYTTTIQTWHTGGRMDWYRDCFTHTQNWTATVPKPCHSGHLWMSLLEATVRYNSSPILCVWLEIRRYIDGQLNVMACHTGSATSGCHADLHEG